MAISTAVRNILFIAIFTYIYHARSVLSADNEAEKTLKTNEEPTSKKVPMYICECKILLRSAEEIKVEECVCHNRVKDPGSKMTVKCSNAHTHPPENWYYEWFSPWKSQPTVNASQGRMKRTRFLREAGVKVRSPRNARSSSTAGEQPGNNDSERATVPPTSPEPSNHQREEEAPVGNGNTSGHMAGSMQSSTTQRSSTKKEATSPMSVDAAAGEEPSGRRQEAGPDKTDVRVHCCYMV